MSPLEILKLKAKANQILQLFATISELAIRLCKQQTVTFAHDVK